MKYLHRLLLLLLIAVSTLAANDPYIGFVYPAGGQQGTTFQITFGGQFIHGTTKVYISGEGVTAKIIEYNKKLAPQTQRLLREQRDEIRYVDAADRTEEHKVLLRRLDKIIGEYVQQPACDSIANILICEVTVASNAKPGEREIRLLAAKGLTNPMPFFVGQIPEVTATPLPTSAKPILGKESLSLRKRENPLKKGGKKFRKKAGMIMDDSTPDDMMLSEIRMGESGDLSDVDDPVVRIQQPCVVNGQIGSGTVDRFLVQCRAGQDLVVEVKARVLVPYLADAVPGWFQPVIKLCDSSGNTVAYNDDYMFNPDPTLIYRISEDGEYLLSIYDAIYRGREDFVYRMTIGCLPFVTSRFPLGGQIGQPARIELKGVNLTQTHVIPNTHVERERVALLASMGNDGLISNPFQFSLDTLPDAVEEEPNNSIEKAQKLLLPIIVNGCIDMPGDKDFYQFDGKKGAEIVAEVMARRLDSPLDSSLMIISPSGNCIGFNDDMPDMGSGINTHDADSWVSVTLPEDGAYTCVITDTQHKGGSAYAYRLRLSTPQPDFELRLVPSHLTILGNGGSGTLTAHLIRRDGFNGSVKLSLKNAPDFEISAPLFGPTQSVAKVTIKTKLQGLREPIALVVEGQANINGKVVKRAAVASEDRMQAFLWRHLVPAQELMAWVRWRKHPARQGKPNKKPPTKKKK